jgi:hypothetical protein
MSTGAWIFATAALVLGVAAPVSYAAATSTVAIGTTTNALTAAVTSARQLQVAPATPGQSVTALLGALTCNANGNYLVPSGKALIITGVTFYNHAASAGSNDEQDLTIGPAASPCSTLIAAGSDSAADETIPETFDPGIAVPAGDAVGGFAGNDQGSASLYGYLVGSGAVPAGTAIAPLLHHDAGSPTTSHR